MADIKLGVVDNIADICEHILCTAYLTEMFLFHRGTIHDNERFGDVDTLEKGVELYLNDIQIDNVCKLTTYLSGLEICK